MNFNEEYYKFLVNHVCDRSEQRDYSKVLHYIFARPFEVPSSILMDSNRAADGIQLRQKFADDFKSGKYYYDILNEIDQVDCNLLEMMVALSIRIEKDIMNDDFIGNRTGLWFWTMMDCIGISVTDDDFDLSDVSDKIDICLERGYDYEGHGSFFTVHNPPRDMRGVEIWYQANWWLMYEFTG